MLAYSWEVTFVKISTDLQSIRHKQVFELTSSEFNDLRLHSIIICLKNSQNDVVIAKTTDTHTKIKYYID